MKKLLTIFMCLLAIGCGSKEKDDLNQKEESENQNKTTVYETKLLDVDFDLSIGGKLFSWGNKLEIINFSTLKSTPNIVRYEYDDKIIEFSAFEGDYVIGDTFQFEKGNSEEYKGWYIVSENADFYAIKPFDVGENKVFIQLGSIETTSAEIDGKKFVYDVIDYLEEKQIDYLGRGLIISQNIDLLGNGTLYLGPDNMTTNTSGENVPVVYYAYLESEDETECTRLHSSKGYYLLSDDAIEIHECYPYADFDIKERMKELMEKNWNFSGKVKYGEIEADAYILSGSESTYSFVIYTANNTSFLLVPIGTSKYYVSDNEYHLSSKEEVFKYMLEDHFIVKK